MAFAFSSNWARLIKAPLDLLSPPTCAGCGVLLPSVQALCAACWPKLPFISRPFCDKYAVPFSFEQADGALSPEAYRFPPPWNKARAVALFEGLAVDLVHGLKYSDRHDYAPLMARLMVRAGVDILKGADAVCAVPLHWQRYVLRRYNQAQLLVRVLARLAHKPHLTGVLRRRKAVRSQVGLSREAREKNVQGAFHVPAAHLYKVKDKRIVLVDDVMTSGATLSAATRALQKAGAAEVNVLVFARVTEVIGS